MPWLAREVTAQGWGEWASNVQWGGTELPTLPAWFPLPLNSDTSHSLGFQKEFPSQLLGPGNPFLGHGPLRSPAECSTRRGSTGHRSQMQELRE
jgi:hypothetical protein